MRLRPLRRRLSRNAPRLAVRRHTPWFVRTLLAAVVLGFAAALALWAFEQGKSLAGLDAHSRQVVQDLQNEVELLRAQVDSDQTKINTADSLLTAEKGAQGKLLERVRELEAENERLHDDLGFFKNLIPAASGAQIAIRSVQAQQNEQALTWQVLLVQSMKNPPHFQGKLEFSVSGLQAGRVWTQNFPAQVVKLNQSQRVSGHLLLPADVKAQTLTVKLTEQGVLRATQSAKVSP